ncbi:hypothetical protein HanXRQr2_Chr11g0482711 [Helianthus annuus]|uniref:Uncharacterized protein n=1 Tax=Helianthus annuus TaxID=4232 RepID=A0A9K3MZE2_HELAN|nr:hypothetical protein HanXRQr2_Chr11g0482711 [Helianthus annuus]
MFLEYKRAQKTIWMFLEYKRAQKTIWVRESLSITMYIRVVHDFPILSSLPFKIPLIFIYINCEQK